MNDIKQLEERIAQLTELVKTGTETIESLKETLKIVEKERDRLADQRAGVEPTISDLRYIKLAEYENAEECKNHKEKGRCIDCVYSTFHKWHLFCNKWRVERLLEECCSDFTNKRG